MKSSVRCTAAESSPRWLRRGAISSAGDGDTLFDDRERAQPLAGRGEDCVDERRRDGGTPGSPIPPILSPLSMIETSIAGIWANPHHRVGVEIGLLHPALLERDFTE